MRYRARIQAFIFFGKMKAFFVGALGRAHLLEDAQLVGVIGDRASRYPRSPIVATARNAPANKKRRQKQ